MSIMEQLIRRMVFLSLIKDSCDLIDCPQNSHLTRLHIVLGGSNDVLPNALHLCLKALDFCLKTADDPFYTRKNDVLGKLAQLPHRHRLVLFLVIISFRHIFQR